MRRATTLVVVFAVVAGAVLPAAATVGVDLSVNSDHGDRGVSPVDAAVSGNHSNDSNDSVAPGQKLAGVVSVQGTEIRSEVRERGFAIALNRSQGPAAKAGVVADRVEEIQDRLETLRERKAELIAAKNDGTISQGQFKAQMAEIVANVSATKRQLNASVTVAAGLPVELLAERGINTSAMEQLRTEASNLTGPEVAAIAREIAGKGVGKPISKKGPPNGTPGNGPGPPDDPGNNGNDGDDGDDRGPPDDPGNKSDGAPGNGNGEGPPDDPGNNSDDGNNQGPPDDPGNNSDDENNQGPPDDPGNNSDDENNQGPPDDPGNNSDDGTDNGNDGDGGPPDDPGEGGGQSGDDGSTTDGPAVIRESDRSARSP